MSKGSPLDSERPAGQAASGPAPRVALSEAEYWARGAALLDGIEATADRLLQDDDLDIDAHRNGHVVELVLPDASRIVVNLQPPLQEIWVAARAGGFHLQWDGQHWRDTRSGVEFHALLSREASAQIGQPVRFEAPAG